MWSDKNPYIKYVKLKLLLAREQNLRKIVPDTTTVNNDDIAKQRPDALLEARLLQVEERQHSPSVSAWVSSKVLSYF